MSLFIRGIYKPINCRECRAIGLEHRSHCTKWWELHFDENSCPLTEVAKPHGRLIDADELIRRLHNSNFENTDALSEIEIMIEDMSVIIDAEGYE